MQGKMRQIDASGFSLGSESDRLIADDLWSLLTCLTLALTLSSLSNSSWLVGSEAGSSSMAVIIPSNALHTLKENIYFLKNTVILSDFFNLLYEYVTWTSLTMIQNWFIIMTWFSTLKMPLTLTLTSDPIFLIWQNNDEEFICTGQSINDIFY